MRHSAQYIDVYVHLTGQVMKVIHAQCIVCFAWHWKDTRVRLGVPNVSFVKRKPKSLGTELKDIVDGLHGVLLFLEIQEGKEAMKTKKHFRELGATAACALRMSTVALF